MALIEEANAYTEQNYPIEKVGVVANDAAFHAYVDGVNFERERCIKAAQDWYCIRCCDTSGEECHYCHIKEHIRKAMEGGDNGND